MESLDRSDKYSGRWVETIVEDHRTPVPGQFAFRWDFPAGWQPLKRQPENRRGTGCRKYRAVIYASGCILWTLPTGQPRTQPDWR